MAIKNNFSQHIIFGIQPNNSMNQYAFNTESSISNTANIWQLRKNFKHFKIYLDLICKAKNSMTKYPEATLLKNIFNELDKNYSQKFIALQQVAIGLLQLGSGHFLREMQKHLQYFESAITPQYFNILRRINFSLPERSELIFHTCNPDIYLWIPAKNKFPGKLLILYPTKSNTFNMPRHIAHFLFASRGIALMYIGNRPNLSTDNALIGHTNQESANFILRIARAFGFKHLYGLGTSYGGFMICKLAQELGLIKVLNFSGAQKNAKDTNNDSFMQISSEYPCEKILSILSKNDDIDRAILRAYDQEGFITERSYLSSKSHGSFSSAFIESKLDSYLDWLLN